MKRILIINTGGTFNKKYDPLNGKMSLDVYSVIDTNLEALLKKTYLTKNLTIDLKHIILKDSLDMNDFDRREIVKLIEQEKQDYKYILIIHGTDTIDKTATFISDSIPELERNNKLVLTGAMIPYSIDPIEAITNFSFALGSLLNSNEKGIFISLHGLFKNFNEIKKNKGEGFFENQ